MKTLPITTNKTDTNLVATLGDLGEPPADLFASELERCDALKRNVEKITWLTTCEYHQACEDALNGGSEFRGHDGWLDTAGWVWYFRAEGLEAAGLDLYRFKDWLYSTGGLTEFFYVLKKAPQKPCMQIETSGQDRNFWTIPAIVVSKDTPSTQPLGDLAERESLRP